MRGAPLLALEKWAAEPPTPFDSALLPFEAP